MKKIIITISVLGILNSCNTNSKNYDDNINELTCPVTIVAINKKNSYGGYSSVVVIDGEKKIKTFSGYHGWEFTNAIASSKNVGDTIKHCYNGNK